jgi:hypothetical protein
MVARLSAFDPVVRVLVRVLLALSVLDVILVIVFRGKWRQRYQTTEPAIVPFDEVAPGRLTGAQSAAITQN